MATSKATHEAFGIGALGAFVKALAESKREQRKQALEQQNFYDTLGYKQLELRQQIANQRQKNQIDTLPTLQPHTVVEMGPNGPRTTSYPGSTPENINGLVPGLGLGTGMLQPGAPKVVSDPLANGGPRETSEFEKARAEAIGKGVAAIEAAAPSAATERTVLDRMQTNLLNKTYKPGPIRGRLAGFAQPAFQTDINSIRGIAIREMGPLFKGSMSDKDLAVMMNAKFDPNLKAPEDLARNIELLKIISAENKKYAAAAKAHSVANNGSLRGFTYNISPEGQSALEELSANQGGGGPRMGGLTPEEQAEKAQLEKELGIKK